MHIVLAGDYPRDPGQISGGVEAVTLYLTQGLQYYPDLKLDVVTLDRWRLGRRVVQSNNITVHYLPLPAIRLPSRLSITATIHQIRTELLRLKPDLIHAQVAGKYAEAAAETGLPWVLTLHGIRFLEADLWPGLVNRYRGWLIKKEELYLITQARHLISISPFIQAIFKGCIRGQVYNIENPIADAFFNLPQKKLEPKQLLFVGRLIPRKGVHILLHAFARLHQRLPGVTLRLAGGGVSANDPADYPSKLRQFVIEAGLGEVVTFLGELGEQAILEEYANCAALVLSSVLETAPMNDEEALAEALYQILGDEVKLQVMGCRGREIARQRFHSCVVSAKTREVYYSILGQMPIN